MSQPDVDESQLRVLEEQGCLLAESGDFNGAVLCLQTVAERGCKRPQLHEMLAQCLLEAGPTQDAIAAASHAAHLAPEVHKQLNNCKRILLH